jgi:DNA-binding transcriptional LysR family regulator
MHSLDDMAIFAAVVDAGGFSSAAKVLGISTPVVSKRVSTLEAQLGAKLLFRTTRRISLTEVGGIFYNHCQRVVAEAKEAEAAVTYLNAAPRGLLRITAPVTFGSHQVAAALPDFLQRYPEVQVEMDVTDRPVDLAQEGYDIAIRLTDEPPPLYVAKQLSRTRRIVCATHEYWERHGRPRIPADLSSHDCIIYSPNPGANQWIFETAGGVETISVQGRFRVNNINAMLEAAIGGVGVVMLSSINIDSAIAAGQLEPVLQNYNSPGANIYALYLPNRYLSSKARAFLDYMVAWCGDEEYPHWTSSSNTGT